MTQAEKSIQKCKQNKLSQRFIRILQVRKAICCKVNGYCKAFDKFIKYDHFIDGRWVYYKFMFTLDLLTLIDILRISSDILLQYLDRLYAPYHYTSLRNDLNTNDSSIQIAQYLMKDCYKQTQLFQMFTIVIGLHLDIKQYSLSHPIQYEQQQNLKQTFKVFNCNAIFEKYELIDKIICQMNTRLMLFNLKKGDFNADLGNNQNKFLQKYYEQSDNFKKSLKYFQLMLEYENIMNQKYKFSQKGINQLEIKKLNKADIKRSKQIIQQLQVIDTNQILKLINFSPQSLTTNFEQIDYLKLKAFEWLIQKYEFQPTDNNLEIIQYFIELNLFVRQSSNIIYTDIKKHLTNAIKNIKTNTQQDKEALISLRRLIPLTVFDEVDLRLSGSICAVWKKQQQNNKNLRSNKIILIGNTHIGKSSFINFLANTLSQEKIAKIANNNFGSTTFYPTCYSIKQLLQNWEICDLPGLMDSRTNIHQLCVCFFFKFLYQKFKTNKIHLYEQQRNVVNK